MSSVWLKRTGLEEGIRNVWTALTNIAGKEIMRKKCVVCKEDIGQENPASAHDPNVHRGLCTDIANHHGYYKDNQWFPKEKAWKVCKSIGINYENASTQN